MQRIAASKQVLSQGMAESPGHMQNGFVLFCFFISGVTGLVYQTLWIRMIDKVIGSAPFAVAAVVAVFMGGLSLGSYVAGRHIDRITQRHALLALYGKLEIAVGFSALLLPHLITLSKPLYVTAYSHMWSHPWVYTLFTFCGCLFLLIVPTTLMGATLPVLCRFYVTRIDRIGTRSSTLYSINTIGAAVGAVLCGFWLIPRLGMTGTLTVTLTANVLVGAGCIWIARVGGYAGDCSEAASIEIGCPRNAAHSQETLRYWALFVFAVSGFCAMACEVFWTRLIGLLLGPTVYAFSVVAATFIVGLAAGGLIFGRLADKLRHDLVLLHVTQLCAAVSSLAASQVLGHSQFFFAKVIHANQHNYTALTLWQALLLFVILLGPTLFWGAAFPLVNRLYTDRLASIGRSIGNAYALNTVGAILGAFAAGYVFTPVLGKEAGLRLTIGLQWGAACLGLVFQMMRPRRRPALVVPAILAALLGVLMVFHYPAWPPGVLSRGWYRDFGDLQDELSRTGWFASLWQGSRYLTRLRSGQQVVFQGEGVGGFTTVEREITSLGTREYAMFNSGKADASSHGDRSTQTLSGHIPMLFHPGAHRVMLLGLASGMTAGEALRYPVTRLDILEINEQVVEACRRYFTPFNNNCLNDPRTRLIVQDGRNHLALTQEHYDVIISEPSNPWMAGLANLYTVEFFELVKQRLTGQGIFAQWIQAYEMDWETFCLLGRTFTAVFRNGALFKVGSGDYLLVGFADNAGLDWSTAQRNLLYAQRSTFMRLKNIDPLARLVVTEDLPTLFGNGVLHTDQRPRLEYAAPRRLYDAGVPLDRMAAHKRRLSVSTQALLNTCNSVADPLDLIEFGVSLNLPLFGELSADKLGPDEYRRYMEMVGAYCDATLVPSYGIFADPGAKELCAARHIRQIRRHLANGGGRPIDHYNLGLALAAAGRPAEAVEAFEHTIALDPGYAEGHSALGLVHAQRGCLTEAVACLNRAAQLAPSRPEIRKNLALVQEAAGDLDAAAASLREAVRMAPGDVAALNDLGILQLRRKKPEAAQETLQAALQADADNAETHHRLGVLYYSQGKIELAVNHFEQSIRLCPDNENARHNLQAALGALGRRKQSAQ